MNHEAVVEEQPARKQKIELSHEDAHKGFGQLVLTIVRLIHELLERQAIRRLENGTLEDEEVERVGLCLSKQAELIEELCEQFGIDYDDLNIDLGPLGKLNSSR